MIDFTNAVQKNKTYAGANGGKISVLYNGEQYMLKFPPFPTINKEMSYTNSCISEYIGCKVFESVGIPVQETVIGTYTSKGKEKVVVACKDFTSQGITLQDFASLKNRIIDSERNGYGTELADILSTIDEQTAMDSETLKTRFWDMFIVDALIGNWDRHNGNWGFLYNNATDEVTLAPVFDCGSSLYPQADEDLMKKILSDKNELNHRIFDIPLSAVTYNGKKINYFKFLSEGKFPDCNKALKRIASRIDMKKIYEIIDNTPTITELQKEFYKTMLTARKERIIDFSLNKLKEKSKKHDDMQR
ncbi:HipA domain-containing protein [Qingrenia yutianensis]|uniref:HipA domain-containing protein n=1 Tax=Qingrenia yutianensis TaxID=2763676 RepID=A0A926INT9_9FIRM|nr:HipA domain-containing protein [Qingrenia yutianensis]MBC8597477.1 HipA domain-containing protein [Qingrenia yutianensis]